MDDSNHSIFEVKYYADGQLCTAVVEGHDDYPTPHDDDAMHYNLWRYTPDGQVVSAFRCRYTAWVSTSAPRDVPPTRKEIEERDALRERADLAELRLADAEQRAAAAEKRASELLERVEELEAQLQEQVRPRPVSPPEPNDVPF